MKFIQIQDVHFDKPFTSISDREELGEVKRLEQRKIFKQVIEKIKKEKIDLLFICGDFLEHEYIRKSTVEYINDLFKEIIDTKIFLIPGNHDPYIKDSYYKIYNWSENVKIFKSKLEKIEIDKINIYGYGFEDFKMRSDQLKDIEGFDESKTNILLTHGDILDYEDETNEYNPINKRDLKKFDYIGIGHIHKREGYYGGTLTSLKFDEEVGHGYIYGKISEKNIKSEIINVEDIKFVKIDFDVSNIKSNEELIERLNELELGKDFYEINLIGERNVYYDINIKFLQKNIIKIKDKTIVKINWQENNNTLRGIFLTKLHNLLEKEKINESQYKMIMENAIKIFENMKIK